MTTLHSATNPVAALALAAGLAMSLGHSLQTARGEDGAMKRNTISVSATGKVSARPDIAEITAGVTTNAPTAKDALVANNETMNRLIQTLKERGVADKDIQTSQVQVMPRYSQPSPRTLNEPIGAPPAEPPAQAHEFIPRIVGYRVENTVRIVARQVDKLGATLDAVVQAGANQIYGISFRLEDSDRLLDDARRRAMAEAKHKATILATEGGVVLGLPLTIEESDGSSPGGPVRYFGAAPMMAPASSAPMPIAAGEQEITVTVAVVYELKRKD